LDLVHSAIHSRDVADEPLPPTVLAQDSDLLRQLFIIRSHGTCISQRPEILRRIETECCDGPQTSSSPAAQLCSVGLGAVLDDRNPIVTGDL
jgi:hypothetical protein